MLKQILEYTFVKFHINPSSITQQFSPHLYVYASVNFTYAQHPLSPHPGYCGAFARLGSPGGGAFANFALPGNRTRTARGFLSEYNYTEGFTGKKADWLICQGQE